MLGSVLSLGGSALGPSTSTAHSIHWYDETVSEDKTIDATRTLPPKIIPEEYEGRHINRVTFWRSEPSTSESPPTIPRTRLHGKAPIRTNLEREPSLAYNLTSEKTEIPESFLLEELEDPVHSLKLASSCSAFVQSSSNIDNYGSFRLPDGKLSNNTMRRGALFCRSGSWLEILDEREARRRHRSGKSLELIRGNPQNRSEFSILHFISVAVGLVSIRGEQSNRFLCMDNQSRLYSAHQRNYSMECVFLEEMLENYYNLYSSCAHFPDLKDKSFKPWYVAIRRDGRPRRGRHSRKRRRSSHFLVVHFDVADSLPIDVDVTRMVSSSIRHSSKGHEIDEKKWFSPAIPPPIIPMIKEEKMRKKKRRKEERLRKEREDRENRARLIDTQRLIEIDRQRELRQEQEERRMSEKREHGWSGYSSRFKYRKRPYHSIKDTNSIQPKSYFSYLNL